MKNIIIELEFEYKKALEHKQNDNNRTRAFELLNSLNIVAFKKKIEKVYDIFMN